MADVYELPLEAVETLKKELKDLQTTGRNDIAEKIKGQNRSETFPKMPSMMKRSLTRPSWKPAFRKLNTF